MSDVVWRCIVRGRVQGVFFRASTRQKAAELRLLGWAKNCPDGSVEVVAVGPGEDIQILHKWLQRGPPNARVDSLECGDFSTSLEIPTEFLIL